MPPTVRGAGTGDPADERLFRAIARPSRPELGSRLVILNGVGPLQLGLACRHLPHVLSTTGADAPPAATGLAAGRSRLLIAANAERRLPDMPGSAKCSLT
jgi:hypothetical protein